MLSVWFQAVNEIVDEMGMDFIKDYADGMIHLNRNGMKKIFLVKYIKLIYGMENKNYISEYSP